MLLFESLEMNPSTGRADQGKLIWLGKGFLRWRGRFDAG
jgi:hypothetical protein